MWQIFLGSLFLSVVHALIPNHWVPLIAIARAEKWSNREALYATFITGFSHTLSTIIIGFFIGFVGIKLSESYSSITRIAAPAVLLVIGMIYLLLDLRASYQHHHFEMDNRKSDPKKSKVAIISSLSIGMFLSPCVELEVYYFQASTTGWLGVFVVSAIYLLITPAMMFMLVYLGLNGIERIKSHFLEHHNRKITGIVLIILAIVAFFVKF